jgi:hypothetical protein
LWLELGRSASLAMRSLGRIGSSKLASASSSASVSHLPLRARSSACHSHLCVRGVLRAWMATSSTMHTTAQHEPVGESWASTCSSSHLQVQQRWPADGRLDLLGANQVRPSAGGPGPPRAAGGAFPNARIFRARFYFYLLVLLFTFVRSVVPCERETYGDGPRQIQGEAATKSG